MGGGLAGLAAWFQVIPLHDLGSQNWPANGKEIATKTTTKTEGREGQSARSAKSTTMTLEMPCDN